MTNQLKSQANAVKTLSSGAGSSGGGAGSIGEGASAPVPPSNAAPHASQSPKSGFFSGPVDMRTPPAMPMTTPAQDAPAAPAPTPPSFNKDEIND
jgi:hypothetical protein